MEDSFIYKLPRKRTLKIEQDFEPMSPRECDNITRMIFVGGHSHYGDDHDVKLDGGYDSMHDFIERGAEDVKKQIKDVVSIQPVYLYSHSGVTISLTPFGCKWDSGCCGFVVVTKEDIRNWFGCKRVTQKDIDKAIGYIESEISTLNQYITGDVYGFIIEDEDENHEDSCWGFYGSDIKENGIFDHLAQADQDAITGKWEKKRKRPLGKRNINS